MTMSEHSPQAPRTAAYPGPTYPGPSDSAYPAYGQPGGSDHRPAVVAAAVSLAFTVLGVLVTIATIELNLSGLVLRTLTNGLGPFSIYPHNGDTIVVLIVSAVVLIGVVFLVTRVATRAARSRAAVASACPSLIASQVTPC